MIAHRFLLPGLIVLGVQLFAPAARADGFDVRLHGKRASIGITIGGHSRDTCPPARPIGYERREWIPGHYEVVCDRVWIPGREERRCVPAVYEWRTDHCGRTYQVCVRPAREEIVCIPGRYETRERRVWVEGGWRVRACN